MKTLVKVWTTLFIMVSGALSAATYDYTEGWPMGSACTVGKSLTFTMGEEEETYCKLSGVSVGNAYTFAVSGCSNVWAEVVYTYSWTDSYEGGSDTYIEYDDLGYGESAAASGVWGCFIQTSSWDELIEDPTGKTEKKVKPKAYYLHIYGDEGSTIMVSSYKGIVEPGKENDKFDPKDDTAAGATKLTISAKEGTAPRTLWSKDEADHFAFSAKDGVYFNFELRSLVGDAVMSLYKKGDDVALTNGMTVLSAYPLAKGDYILKVAHSGSNVDASYTLAYSSANVGAISFAKTAVTAKKSAGTVTLTVNRSSAEGKVRVQYGTVNGTAQPGVDYFAQNGELVWDNGDKKAKTITIKLIPEAFATEALSRRFVVQLLPAQPQAGEYVAAITAGKDVATVTVTETAAKSPKSPQKATVKGEEVPIETGTFQGVVTAEEGVLANGFAALASVTFTANKNALEKDTPKKALSAKVILGGKTYAFTADTWSDESDAKTAVAVMSLDHKIDGESCTSVLRVVVPRGETTTEGDWTNAVASVQLTMNVPGAKGEGYQANVPYAGRIFRDNSKVQGYLDEVFEAVGYYTAALVPTNGLSNVPGGNGYLTLTIDNKGKAKVAGLLADGSTKISYTSSVAVQDEGATLFVPVFVAKSPYCFGGTLKLVLGDDTQYVIDTADALVWNNDNALLTYAGQEGWRARLGAVGGYFNTVDNLQAHYLTCVERIATADAGDWLQEGLASGYTYVAGIGPDDMTVELLGNSFVLEKKQLVKSGRLVDFEKSVNPGNVQVKLTRATGIVTGSFSIWTQTADGSAQKELTGFKHNGILIFSRRDATLLDDNVLTAGFFTQTVKLTNTGATRKYTASYPFNILAIDQGEPDWYAEDWGEKPAQ